MPSIEIAADITAFIEDPAGDYDEIAHKVTRLETVLQQAKNDGIIADFKVKEYRQPDGSDS